MGLRLILISALLLLVDLYVFQAVRSALSKKTEKTIKLVGLAYWVLSFLVVAAIFLVVFVSLDNFTRRLLMVAAVLLVLFKFCVLPPLVLDDLRRGIIWIFRRIRKTRSRYAATSAERARQPGDDRPATGSDALSDTFQQTNGNQSPAGKQQSNHRQNNEPITRSQFLSRAGLIIGAVPITTLGYGLVSSSVYDYRVRRVQLRLPGLSKSFHGLRIAQLSDIHAGSLNNKTAVSGGVDLLMAEKPDVIFFTGDLVNDASSEMQNWVNVFDKVKAPLGVYSTTGNHDYGDYRSWPSAEAKRRNFEDLQRIHANMGWDLLMNEHRTLEQGGDKIAVLGIENWGALSRFPKYGQMELAVRGTEEAAVKLLLSHDPSHWQAEVLKKYPDVQAMFSGHTHGMQFGIRLPGFQWSPAQYVYPEWAGFYQEGDQQLYVNVGYGFLGYPGRVGIRPEITIFELVAG